MQNIQGNFKGTAILQLLHGLPRVFLLLQGGGDGLDPLLRQGKGICRAHTDLLLQAKDFSFKSHPFRGSNRTAPSNSRLAENLGWPQTPLPLAENKLLVGHG